MSNMYYTDYLYGDYRNMNFGEIFPNMAEFSEAYHGIVITPTLTEEQVATLYLLLAGEYANSPIASSDVNRFQIKLFNITNTQAPIYFKRMEIQNKLIGMDLDSKDLLEGSTAIYNTAFNPSVAPTTNTLDELTTINQQNSNKRKRGKLEAYAALSTLMDESITEKFLAQYRKLFLTFASPEEALWYETLEPNIPINQEENK